MFNRVSFSHAARFVAWFIRGNHDGDNNQDMKQMPDFGYPV
jgi:hypothetical protein